MDFEQILTGAWAADPQFVVLCKTLWGPAVGIDDVVTIAKDAPDASAVHVPGSTGRNGAWRKPKKLPVLNPPNTLVPVAKTQHFERTKAVVGHGLLAGVAGAGAAFSGSHVTGQTDKLAESIRTLKATPKGRKMLQTGIAARRAGKVALVSTATAGLAAMAGQQGRQLYDHLNEGTQHVTRNVSQKVIKPRTTVTKSAVGGQLTTVDEDRHQVFGWASIVAKDGLPVVDLQGDYIGIDELEKSAYTYVQSSRVGGNMHRRVDAEGNVIAKTSAPYHVADLIESFVVTPEKIEKMGLPTDTPVGWWVGFQVHDPDTWAEVKSGDRTMFSVHGVGKRTPIGEVTDFGIDGTELR